MSSHHFVREGQEPALLIVDALTDDHLMSILEWSPLVLVASQAIVKVATWGILVDVILLDKQTHSGSVAFDVPGHVGPATVVEAQHGLADAALEYLRSKGQYTLHVLIHEPEQHFLQWDHADDFEVTLIDASMKWSRRSSGRFEKWMSEGSFLMVQGSQHWSASGSTSIELLSATPNIGVVSVSEPGIVEISSKGPFWVGEKHR